MKTVLAAPELLSLEKVTVHAEAIVLVAHTVQLEVRCPCCKTVATKVHSRYVRQVADLPWAGLSVRLELHTRKFFCRNDRCQRQIFCERLPSFVASSARQTIRFNEALTFLGMMLGGQAGARMGHAMGLGISPDTLLARMRQTVAQRADAPPIRVLGVDDFAFRRGQRYGTLLVDLEQRQPIDLLEDREGTTLAQWLKTHPGIEIVTRDRSTSYAEGIRQGAPDAQQVADRWHLLKNLGEALERLLTRRSQSLTTAVDAVNQADATDSRPVSGAPVTTMLSSRTVQELEQHRAKRLALYQQVRTLWQKGETILGIAQQLHLSRVTVRKYCRSEVFPERAAGVARGSQLECFLPLLKQHWAAGCHNARQLWRILVAAGYPGKEAMVRRYVRRLRQSTPHNSPPASAPPAQPERFRRPSTKRIAWWLLTPAEQLQPAEASFLGELCQLDQTVAMAQKLARRFQQLVRQKQADQFADWLKETEASDLMEFKGFAEGLKKDEAAVQAALQSPWSNGQTEGQINRLKMLKRQMYGRANFDLLKARVLYAP